MRHYEELSSLENLSKIAAVKNLNANSESDCAALSRKNGIAVVGSMNADYTIVADRLPNPGETVNGNEICVLPGGKSGNQAVSAAKIGANVCMFGAVGNDSNADFLINSLKSAGVDTKHVRHVEDAKSGATVITVDSKSGENTIVYASGSNCKVDVEYIESDSVKSALTSAKVLGLCFESPMETVAHCAKLAHENGVKVLINDSPFLDKIPQDLIDSSDILLVNEHEMAQLLHIREPEDGDWDSFDWEHTAKVMHDFGFDEAIVTLGSEGSVVLNYAEEDPVCRILPQKVKAVDTTGCGDAFMGTVLACLSCDMQLDDAAALASYVSAYAATGFGAQASYGSVEEIRKYFGK